MKSILITLLLFTVTTSQGQLLLPEKVNHTNNGVCDVIDYPKVNTALLNFFEGYGLSSNDIYFGSYLPLHKNVYIEMLDSLVKYGEVGSYETFTKELDHNDKVYHVALLSDKDGYFYDILINQGERGNPRQYIEFRPKYYQCDVVGQNDELHQFSNKLYGKIVYYLERKVVNVINKPRVLEFNMDDGSSIIYEFCHIDKNSGYHEYSMIDTSEGVTYKLYGSDISNCNHRHDCVVRREEEVVTDQNAFDAHNLTAGSNTEICNH